MRAEDDVWGDVPSVRSRVDTRRVDEVAGRVAGSLRDVCGLCLAEEEDDVIRLEGVLR